MKKNAIIDIIENDLKEMLTLLASFKDSERIPKDFIELLGQKHAGIGREVALLNYWASENIADVKEVSLTAEVRQPIAQEEQKQEQKPEPQPRKPRVIKITNVASAKTVVRPVAPSKPVEEAKPQVVEPEPQAQPIEQVVVPPVVKPEPKPAKEVKEVKLAPPVAEVTVSKAHTPSATDITTYGTPVDDIRKAIGFNDRFLYQREIFGGNSMAYDAALETINASEDYASAHDYLMREFHLDETKPDVEAFLKAVHRRFL